MKRMIQEQIIGQLSRTLLSIVSAIPEIETVAHRLVDDHREIGDVGYFRPEQDEAHAGWFTSFLILRSELWEVIDRAHENVQVKLTSIESDDQYRNFVIGFVAACHVVRMDRLLLEKVATHTLVQRKLNEAIPENNVQRKQYSEIFESFVDPSNANRIQSAIRFLDQRAARIQQLANDRDVGGFVRDLPEHRSWLDESKRNYFKRLLSFIRHAWRRRGATIKQHAQFRILETSGRVVAEVANKGPKQVTDSLREAARLLLMPGDVIITRQHYALSNLFLPGFWPHAAMFIGTETDRRKLEVDVPDRISKKWHGDICTFEAKKDGVLLRTLENTLAVDCFVVLRPALSAEGIKQAVERVVIHEGKLYNFDFDFFRSDRLVCTEVVYRAFDGIEGMRFQLNERAGRPTLAAEDLCDMALDTGMFQVVAICGVEGGGELATGREISEELLRKSYRS